MTTPAVPTVPPDDSSELRRIFAVLWRRKWLVLGVVIVATVGTYAISKLATKQYQTTAQVQLQPQTSLVTGSTQDLGQELAAAERTVQTQRLAALAAQMFHPPPRPSGSLLGHVKVSTDSDAGFVILQGNDSKPPRAAAIANAFATALIDSRAARTRGQIDQSLAQLNQQFAALPATDVKDRNGLEAEIQRLRALRAGNGFVDQIVQPALIPGAPVSPRPSRNAVIAFVLSALIAVGLAFLLERLDRRLHDTDELAALTGTPLLAEIPPSAFSAQPPPAVAAEAFQMLRANLTYFNIDHRLQSVVVTSPLHGDGKTTVAMNLARAAAQAGRDVFLVDSDLRHPQAGQRMGVTSGAAGLGSVLVGERALEDVVGEAEIGDGRLRVLPSGPPPPNPSALIASDAMRALVTRLTQEADLVVFDTPPMLVVGDAIPLLEQASGIILVARLGWTTREAVRRAHDLISNTRGVMLGAVVTNVKPSQLYGYKASEARAAADLVPDGQVPASQGRPRLRRWPAALRARR